MAENGVSKLECLRNNQTYTEVQKKIKFQILGKNGYDMYKKKNI